MGVLGPSPYSSLGKKEGSYTLSTDFKSKFNSRNTRIILHTSTLSGVPRVLGVEASEPLKF